MSNQNLTLKEVKTTNFIITDIQEVLRLSCSDESCLYTYSAVKEDDKNLYGFIFAPKMPTNNKNLHNLIAEHINEIEFENFLSLSKMDMELYKFLCKSIFVSEKWEEENIYLYNLLLESLHDSDSEIVKHNLQNFFELEENNHRVSVSREIIKYCNFDNEKNVLVDLSKNKTSYECQVISCNHILFTYLRGSFKDLSKIEKRVFDDINDVGGIEYLPKLSNLSNFLQDLILECRYIKTAYYVIDNDNYKWNDLTTTQKEKIKNEVHLNNLEDFIFFEETDFVMEIDLNICEHINFDIKE